MPWLSIATWLLTFLISKSSGASNGKAALLATGAGLASYYLIDPANNDNLMGVSFGGAKATPGDVNMTKPGTATVGDLASIGKTVVSETGETLRGWGPTGTLAVVAGTTAIKSDSAKKWRPWLIGGAALFLLKKRS